MNYLMHFGNIGYSLLWVITSHKDSIVAILSIQNTCTFVQTTEYKYVRCIGIVRVTVPDIFKFTYACTYYTVLHSITP